jgi:hypothetical protein
MKIANQVSGILACALLTIGHLAVQAKDHEQTNASGHQAFGEGTSFIEPGVLTTFQFDDTEIMCNVGRAVMPDGTVLQMFMVSEHVDSVTIDPHAKTVTITGDMVSFTKLRFPDGSTARLWETVPFKAFAADHASPGIGKDFFSLSVGYANTPELDQFDLFGGSATFAGTLASGNVTVR